MADQVSAQSFLELSLRERVHLLPMEVPRDIALSLLGNAIRMQLEGREFGHVHHLLVDEETCSTLLTELHGRVEGVTCKFRTVREAVNHLRKIAVRRGVSSHDIVKIDCADDGTPEGLCQRAERFMGVLSIDPRSISWDDPKQAQRPIGRVGGS